MTREKWRQIIKSQRASGQTAAAWCREHQVGQSTFFAWKRRLRSAAADFGQLPSGLSLRVEDSRGAAEFVEVHATANCGRGDADAMECGSVAIEVCCRGGRRLLLRRGVDPALLVEMIQVLEGLPSKLEGLA